MVQIFDTSPAIVKDLYTGEKRAHILAVIMAMVITAPVVAPIFGSLLLKFASWRAIFFALAGFGLSEQAFSLFFAANAVGAMLGPILYIRISKRFHPNTIISACFIVMALSGVMVAGMGSFALTMLPATIAVTCIRPPSANLMLEQQDEDTGSAASFINFFGMIMGSIGMLLISLSQEHLVFFIGMMQILVGGGGYLFWLSVKNNACIVQTR